MDGQWPVAFGFLVFGREARGGARPNWQLGLDDDDAMISNE